MCVLIALNVRTTHIDSLLLLLRTEIVTETLDAAGPQVARVGGERADKAEMLEEVARIVFAIVQVLLVQQERRVDTVEVRLRRARRNHLARLDVRGVRAERLAHAGLVFALRVVVAQRRRMERNRRRRIALCLVIALQERRIARAGVCATQRRRTKALTVRRQTGSVNGIGAVLRHRSNQRTVAL